MEPHKLSVVLSRLRADCVGRFDQAKKCKDDRLPAGQAGFNFLRFRFMDGGLAVVKKLEFCPGSENPIDFTSLIGTVHGH